MSNSKTARSEMTDHKLDGSIAKQILLNLGRWRLSVMGGKDIGSHTDRELRAMKRWRPLEVRLFLSHTSCRPGLELQPDTRFPILF